MSRQFSVAVVGATGAVGTEMISTLEGRNFPVGQIKLLASGRSAGRELTFRGETVLVEELTDESFEGVEIALFSAGGSISERFAPSAVKAGAVVVDNTSHFRMEPDIPLVVPEVNPEAIAQYTKRGIIANPNCSTIQMVVALKPIYDEAGIKRVVVSTYQAVSGTGLEAIDELAKQSIEVLQGKPPTTEVYPHQIAFNCLPHIDVFLDNGYTKEEMKMVEETKKILEDDTVALTATTVRVPVFYSHSESVNVETKKKLPLDRLFEILRAAPGVEIIDDVANNVYPLATDAAGQDPTYVGRIREDESCENGINLWVVSDNIRKGAALNAVQIAEILAEKYL